MAVPLPESLIRLRKDLEQLKLDQEESRKRFQQFKMLKFVPSFNTTSEKEGDGEKPVKQVGGVRAVLRRRKQERGGSDVQVMPEINLNLRQSSVQHGQGTDKPNLAHFRTKSVAD